MSVPPNVLARRHITVTQGNSTIPEYPGLQHVMFIGTSGKSDVPRYNPPYPPNTPVPSQVKYLDTLDNGVEPLPSNPSPKYVCYLTTDGQFIVDVDTFPPKTILHNYAGWPIPTEA